MISVQLVNDKQRFEQLRTEWDTLLSRCAIQDPFLSWEWLYTWWHHFGHNFRLMLVTAREDDKLVGLAPLMLQTRNIFGLKLRVLLNIGFPPPDIGGFLFLSDRPDIALALTNCLIERRSTWDVISLREFPQQFCESSGFLTALNELCVQDIYKSTHWTIELEGSWQIYFEKIKGDRRRVIRRRERRLSELGTIRFARYIGQEFQVQWMEDIFRINEQSIHPDTYVLPSQKLYHKHLAEVIATKGWLDVSFLYLNDQAIAYIYGFLYNGRATVWRSGFNTAYRPYAPGTLLTLEYIKDCFAHGLRAVDFLRGDHEFKREWQSIPTIYCDPKFVQRKFFPQLVMIWWPSLRSRTRHWLENSSFFKRLLKRYYGYQRRKIMMSLSQADDDQQ